MPDSFFTQTKCDRCGSDLKCRTISWFSNEVICLDCTTKESQVKQQMRTLGVDPKDYEGHGNYNEILASFMDTKNIIQETFHS